MRSIQRRFERIQKQKPNAASYICFAEAVEGQGFSQQAVHRQFTKLVDPDDYGRSERQAVLRHLDLITKPPRTTKN